MLGTSDIPRNMPSMAELARLGCLPVTPETEAALQAACADIMAMRLLLMKALGARDGEAMILKASRRGGRKALGLHLPKAGENEHAELHHTGQEDMALEGN